MLFTWFILDMDQDCNNSVILIWLPDCPIIPGSKLRWMMSGNHIHVSNHISIPCQCWALSGYCSCFYTASESWTLELLTFIQLWKKRTHVEMRGPSGPQLHLELNVILSHRIVHYKLCQITYSFSGAGVLMRPGSARTPQNWMKVKNGALDGGLKLFRYPNNYSLMP